VVVAVVKVGHVRVGVNELSVHMNMLMTDDRYIRVVMVLMMDVLVRMFVIVFDGQMPMVVDMVGAQHEADTNGRDA
jgi:hypothetical protein